MCSTHGRAGAVNTQHLAVKPGWGLTVSPWHSFTESTQRPRPIPARLYRGESQQNGGTDTSHVTSLCFQWQFEVKQMHTTRLTNKISNPCNLIMAHVVERGRNIQNSSRSVVCTKEPLWRPFCTSLRRQHSGAPRHENTAKVIHHQPATNKENIPIPPLFPSQLASAALPGWLRHIRAGQANPRSGRRVEAY